MQTQCGQNLRPESHSCLIYHSSALYILCDLWWEGGLRASGQGEDPGTAEHHARVDRCAAVYWTCQGGQVLTLTRARKSQASLVSCFYHYYEYWLGLFKTETFGQKAITYPMPVLCDDFYCNALLTRRISGHTGGSALPKLFMQTVGQLMCENIILTHQSILYELSVSKLSDPPPSAPVNHFASCR